MAGKLWKADIKVPIQIAGLWFFLPHGSHTAPAHGFDSDCHFRFSGYRRKERTVSRPEDITIGIIKMITFQLATIVVPYGKASYGNKQARGVIVLKQSAIC